MAYGLYQAFFVSTNTLFESFYARMRKFFHVKEECASWQIFQVLRTVLIITFGRYLSRAPGFMHAFGMWKATFSKWNPWIFFDGTLNTLGLSAANVRLMLMLIIMVFVVDFFHEKGYRFREHLNKKDIVFRWVVYFAAIFGILIFGMYGWGYSAGNFIYQGF